ncbi:CLUMA_CG009030, isoform A [Clunio marinus]|uniref:CLUMA_CG009030, isoform A n=1 Tax=Clunio marinus TaxID=568069 RepID=A0A1J1I9C2_9DIPT|nr:CLUMA_CG009030, isoform A [Clunio marinus]
MLLEVISVNKKLSFFKQKMILTMTLLKMEHLQCGRSHGFTALQMKLWELVVFIFRPEASVSSKQSAGLEIPLHQIDIRIKASNENAKTKNAAENGTLAMRPFPWVYRTTNETLGVGCLCH